MKTLLADLLNVLVALNIFNTYNISFYTTFHSVTVITLTMAPVNAH